MKKYMFTAEWCSGCKIMKPIVQQIADVEIIDVDKNKELTEKYLIMALPTFIIEYTDVTSGNNVVDTKYGILPEQVIKDFFNNNEQATK